MTHKLKSVRTIAGTIMDTMEKTIEHDAVQWNGLLVWEAGDGDTVYNILSNTITQDRTDTLKAIEGLIEGRKKLNGDKTHPIYDFDAQYDLALQDLKEDITRLFSE